MTASVRISAKLAREALRTLDGSACDAASVNRLADEIRRQLKPKASRKLARQRREMKRAMKAEETRVIREAVFARAEGKCEHCGWRESLQLDHFFGRGKVPQCIQNCIALCLRCHRDKTNNVPSAAFWLEEFIGHADSYGYSAEAARARNRLQFVETRSGAVTP